MKSLAALALGFIIISNGHAISLPDIGNAQYTRSCAIVRNGDDDVLAFCSEDHGLYRYDFDGQPYANSAGVPITAPGWVVKN